uniref:Calmodulin-lysine N-methyltransferase n=1 Tax=Rhizochromulina marina TaxID=1034831 RepID=A0A7S2W8K5_9STRA|mmetsp:Transcript_17504/g.51191  ORF Transcript_17504/g.51191 Transcript_17504/m.51191 type:complete len:278 (+) Transcript_17504:223-1056(+)
MDALEEPSDALREVLQDLEYELEAVTIPGLPGEALKILTIDELPLEALTLLEEANAEISGRRAWPGSVLLASSLCGPEAPPVLEGRTVIELGAGSALTSMAAARLGARTVVATDGDRTSVDLAHQNFEANGFGCPVDEQATPVAAATAPGLSADRLLWGSGPHNQQLRDRFAGGSGFDVVLAGDVLYKQDLPALFFESVKELIAADGIALLCHIPRAGVSQELVVARAEEAGLAVVRLPLEVDFALGLESDQFSRDELLAACLYSIKLPDASSTRGG